MRLQWRLHRAVWNWSGGRLGRTAAGLPVLELVTTGRKSGEDRSILINYIERAEGPALVGTNAGSDRDPYWVQNLRADPKARVRRDGSWTTIQARFLERAEAEEVLSDFAAANPAYDRYRRVVNRPVPVVTLEPAGG